MRLDRKLKNGIILIIFCIMVFLFGCGKKSQMQQNESQKYDSTEAFVDNESQEYSSSEKFTDNVEASEEENEEPKKLSFLSQFTYVHCYDFDKIPDAQMITNKSELDQYYKTNMELFDFQNQGNFGIREEQSFFDIIMRYEESWFHKNVLVLIPIITPGSEYEYEVVDVICYQVEGKTASINFRINEKPPTKGEDLEYSAYLIVELRGDYGNDTPIQIDIEVGLDVQ